MNWRPSGGGGGRALVVLASYRQHEGGPGDFHRQSYRAETLDSTVDQDRFLFRAGREGYTYPELLQIRSGAAAQILMPSEQAKRRTRIVSTFIALAYVFVVGPLIGLLAAFSGFPIVAPIVAVVGFFVGLIGILVWWDRMSLPLLAENPRSIRDIELLGVQSFGTFQEIRARAQGEELRIAVSGSRGRLEEATRKAGFAFPSA